MNLREPKPVQRPLQSSLQGMTGDMSPQGHKESGWKRELPEHSLWCKSGACNMPGDSIGGKMYNIYSDGCTGINEKVCNHLKEMTLMNFNKLINHARDPD